MDEALSCSSPSVVSSTAVAVADADAVAAADVFAVSHSLSSGLSAWSCNSGGSIEVVLVEAFLAMG